LKAVETMKHGRHWRALGIMLLMLAGCSPPDAPDAHSVTLHVADQLNVLRSALESAGEAEPKGYKIQWSHFIGGPAIIAAETGGSVDLGWMRETPIVFAQAAGSPIRVVMVMQPIRTGTSTIGLIVPANSPIRTPPDLKGKKIAYMAGTVTQYYLMRLLELGKLNLNDITSVSISPGALQSLLENGGIDAAVSAEPMISSVVDQGKIRLLHAEGEPLTPEFSFLVARASALKDPKLEAAMADFVLRVARAYKWQREHVDTAAPIVAKLYKIPVRVVKTVIARSPLHGVPINAEVIAKQQAETDAFLSAGLIKQHINVTSLFDTRFNARISALKDVAP
jgi:sulfonate transport system substrate-binding protein